MTLGGLLYKKTRQSKANGQDDERNTSKNSAASFSEKMLYYPKEC